MPRINRGMIYLGACLIVGIRLARERQVNHRVISTMPRMTAKLFREILDSIEGDIETLEIEKTVTESEEVPAHAERSAI